MKNSHPNNWCIKMRHSNSSFKPLFSLINTFQTASHEPNWFFNFKWIMMNFTYQIEQKLKRWLNQTLRVQNTFPTEIKPNKLTNYWNNFKTFFLRNFIHYFQEKNSTAHDRYQNQNEHQSHYTKNYLYTYKNRFRKSLKHTNQKN